VPCEARFTRTRHLSVYALRKTPCPMGKERIVCYREIVCRNAFGEKMLPAGMAADCHFDSTMPFWHGLPFRQEHAIGTGTLSI